MAVLSVLRATIARGFTPKNPSTRRTRLDLQSLEGRDIPDAGGGFTAGGVFGQYFANPNLAGTPSFTRTDVRINFDWQGRAPGGSNSPEYAGVSADSFSVRWTGQLVPKYTQTFTFHAIDGGGIRVWIRPALSPTWVPLIDHWASHASADDYSRYSLIAGRTYDIKVEYAQASGSAMAELKWSGPYFQEEVIEPAMNLGVNAVTYDYQVYADAAKSGRPEWGDVDNYFGLPNVPADANGNPIADAGHIFWEGQDPAKTAGTYQLSFTGQADVSSWFGDGQFVVNGTNYGTTLPSGTGYDPATNTTTAQVLVAGDALFGLNFRNTQHEPWEPTGSGIGNVHLLRPIAPGSTTTYQPGELFESDVKAAYSRFTTLRYLTANFNAEQNWSDRMLPGGMKAAWGDQHAVWEDEVMLANETGKDLYITIPINASTDYVQKLAQLLKYGSDGVNPYTGPVANPVYPGLNPNLRVYVEWGNEVWNWAFSQGNIGANASRDAVLNHTPEGLIINYDGKAPWGDFRRWDALKTVEASNTFRTVFGDAAMGNQVRMLLEYQYDNIQDTAAQALQFTNTYFNNADGVRHVTTPHPVSYYLWGAGGASYFGATNPLGIATDIPVPDGGFELPPASSPWVIAGSGARYMKAAGPPADLMTIPGVGAFPAPPQGTQALYLSGAGTATVTINFPRAGVYALAFKAAAPTGANGSDPLDFYFDDQRVTPYAENLAPNPAPWVPGSGLGRDPNAFVDYGTVPVYVAGPGKHTFQMVGRGTATQTTAIDDVRVESTDAIFNSLIPGGGQAAGQVSRTDYQTQLIAQAKYALAYGLKVVAYEGGWSLGGDTQSVPIQSWAKYYDARAADVMARAIDAFNRTGGTMNVLGTYDQWHMDDAAHAAIYPLVRGIDARLSTLPAAPTYNLPSNPPLAPTPIGVLPPGWSNDAIGAPAVNGLARFDGTRWVVQGSGQNTLGTSDQFQFADTAASGDVTLTAQVEAPSAANGWGRAGVMVRDGIGGGDAFAAVFRKADGSVVFQTRDAAGNPITSVGVPEANVPIWVKLVRTGDSFSGYVSLDGIRWFQITAARTVRMPVAVRVGLALTSRDPNQSATATFSNVSVVD